jgi:flagellar motor switch protein FliN/FliY
MSEDTSSENVDLTDFSQQERPPRPEPTPSGHAAQDAAGPAEDDIRTASDLEAVYDVPVNVTAVLGRTNIEVADLLKLDEGDVVELDRKVGEAIDIYVNNRLVARGEVVLVEDRLGVTMTEIIKGETN